MAEFWLKVVEPGKSARVVTVEGPLDIGRDGEDIKLDDPTVSRHHVVVGPTDGGLRVSDNGSANGTFIEGARLDGATVVAPGVCIKLGETELYVVQGRTTTSAADADAGAVDPTFRASEAARALNKAAAKPGRGTSRPGS